MKTYLDPKTQAFIRYYDFPGSDPPLIFIAGWGLASTAIYARAAFEPGLHGRRSIWVDLFGCGFSDSPEDFGYSLEEHAAALAGLLDHIGSKSFILVGHSMGGAVAVTLASLRPERVSQLLLAEANLEAGGGTLSKSIAEQTQSGFLDQGYQELLDTRRKDGLAGNVGASIGYGLWRVAYPLGLYLSAVSLVRGTDPVMWERLIDLAIPSTYIFGGNSLEAFEEDRIFRARLEEHGIRVAVVPNAGHGMMVENPKGFAAVVKEEITRLEQTSDE